MATSKPDRNDATKLVITAIEVGPTSRDEYNIEAIVDELRDAEGANGWDYNEIAGVTFWEVIAKHAKPVS